MYPKPSVLPQGGYEKTRPNKHRAALIWQDRVPSIFLGLLNPIREVEQCRVTRNFIFIAEGFVFGAVHLCYCHWHTSFVGMDFQCQAAPDRKKFLKRE